MISGENKFYHDSLDGEPFFDFVAKEVPEFVTNYFPISAEPEHSYIAGLSMGGYFLLFQQLLFTGNIAAIALGQNILAHGLGITFSAEAKWSGAKASRASVSRATACTWATLGAVARSPLS